MSDHKVKYSDNEIEQLLIERELENTDPLDVHAAMFKFYIPRFKGQINFLSKKQFQLMMTDLAGSEFNKDEDVRKITALSNGLNLNAINRVARSVIESPFLEEEFKLKNEKEEKLFRLFDDLLTNKYYSCLKDYLDKNGTKKEDEAETFIKHKIDLHSKAFQSRERVEKDAFVTASQLLTSKYLMIFTKTTEESETPVEEIKQN